MDTSIDLPSSPESEREEEKFPSGSILPNSPESPSKRNVLSKKDFSSVKKKGSVSPYKKTISVFEDETFKKKKKRIGPLRANGTSLPSGGGWMSSKKSRFDTNDENNNRIEDDDFLSDVLPPKSPKVSTPLSKQQFASELRSPPTDNKDSKEIIPMDDSPSSQLPPCPYGTRCYRKNPVHFLEYSHPPSHASNQSSQAQRTSPTPLYPHGSPSPSPPILSNPNAPKLTTVSCFISSNSKEQENVMDKVLSGKNVFFTGSAGTGKSTLLRALIRRLPPTSTFVTAATGIAAINIGGITLHSFAGVGKAEGAKYDLAQDVLNSSHKQWWERAQCLIIDEISMVSADLFEKLDYIGKVVRRDPKPFGGLQLVCSGDFFQLPPVVRAGEETERLFCFESPVWREAIHETIELTNVFRQSESEFVSMLNEIRHGYCSPETIKKLEGCKTHSLDNVDGIEPTILHPYNRDVDEVNEGKLSAISAKGKLYRSKDRGREPFLSTLKQVKKRSESFLSKHCPIPSELKLKIGAQVMLIRNLSVRRKGLVNGSRGVVIDFEESRRGFPRVRFDSGVEMTVEPEKWTMQVGGKEVASREQVPLKLAWALSIHKTQGITITFAEMSLKRVFEYGQAYVALSRVASLEGLRLLDFSVRGIRAHPKVIAFCHEFTPSCIPPSVLSYQADRTPSYSTTKSNEDVPLPFRVQYAASGRSGCKHCTKKIDKDVLRLGKMIPSKSFDGFYPIWFHFNCFFAKFSDQLNSFDQLEGADKLKPLDLQKLEKIIKCKYQPPKPFIPKSLNEPFVSVTTGNTSMNGNEARRYIDDLDDSIFSSIPMPSENLSVDPNLSKKAENEVFKKPFLVSKPSLPQTAEEKRSEKKKEESARGLLDAWEEREYEQWQEQQRKAMKAYELVQKAKEKELQPKSEVKEEPDRRVGDFFSKWKSENKSELQEAMEEYGIVQVSIDEKKRKWDEDDDDGYIRDSDLFPNPKEKKTKTRTKTKTRKKPKSFEEDDIIDLIED